MKHLALLVLTSCLSCVEASDFQVRSKHAVQVQLSEQASASIATALRFDELFARLVQVYGQLELAYTFCPGWELSGAYRSRQIERDEGWRPRHELLANLKKEWSCAGFTFGPRLRHQQNLTDHSWTWRTRFKVSYLVAAHWDLHVEASDELFFSELERLVRNRWELGLSFPLWPERLEGYVAFRQEHRERSAPGSMTATHYASTQLSASKPFWSAQACLRLGCRRLVAVHSMLPTRLSSAWR